MQAAFDRLSLRMLNAERFMVEIFLCISSIWAAAKFLTLPKYFTLYMSGYAFLTDLNITEQDWGLIAAIAAALKIIGLTMTMFRFCRGCGLAMRCVGLLISGFFWNVLGLSFLMGNSDSVTAIPMALMGCAAWWTLIRFPTSRLPRAARTEIP